MSGCKPVKTKGCGSITAYKESQAITCSDFFLNISLDTLKERMKNNLSDDIYFYVMTTVSLDNGKQVQKGSGPNLEGSRVTLSTCKHWMRTFPSIKKGTWIAGLSNKNCGQNLFYLAQVEDTFLTHRELETSLSKKDRKIKSMSNNFLGDLFETTTASGNTFDDYKAVSHHSHKDEHHHFTDEHIKSDLWGYKQGEKETKLLSFDPNTTCVWEQPLITHSLQTISQGQRKNTVAGFLSILKEK